MIRYLCSTQSFLCRWQWENCHWFRRLQNSCFHSKSASLQGVSATVHHNTRRKKFAGYIYCDLHLQITQLILHNTGSRDSLQGPSTRIAQNKSVLTPAPTLGSGLHHHRTQNLRTKSFFRHLMSSNVYFLRQRSQNFLLQYLYEVAWRCVILQWNRVLLLNCYVC